VGALYAGTSGFSYLSWRGAFYPADARQEDLLYLYAARLPSVELHGAVRRLPSEEQFERWAQQVPPDFRFAVKLSERITDHGDVGRCETFCARLRALGERLGPLLVQLPDERTFDPGFLGLLLDCLEPGLRIAVELRHESWGIPATRALLDERGAVRVGSLDGEAGFRYLRLREPPYDEDALASWAARLHPLLASGMDVYCYFMHEDDPRGTTYAARLLELVERAG
jgi:uncharacterized protein YecE (DUF72 family)